MKLLVAFFCLCSVASAADSTRLFLRSKLLRVGDSTLSVQIVAVNNYPLDVAGLQGTVRVAADRLQLVNIDGLKPDGTVKSALASMGNESQAAGMSHRPIIMGSTSKVDKVKDTVPVVALTFKVLKSLTKGETLKVNVDQIELSTMLAAAISCNNAITLNVIVADKDAVDTTGNDDTTNVEDRLRVRLSALAGNATEGYLYQETPKKVAIDIAVDFKAPISSLQLTVKAPNDNWTMAEPKLPDLEKVCLMSPMGSGRYKLIYSGDKPEHPLLPNLSGNRKTIINLSFSITDNKTPFGDQRIAISEIAVGSLYETGLKINTDTSLTINLNRLFGKVFGRKGDVNFPAEWTFGDGKLNQEDVNLVTDYILGKTTLNDYQLWAADLTNNSKVEVDDLVELQKQIAISGVDDYQISDQEIDNNNLLSDGQELVVYNLLGAVVLKTTEQKDLRQLGLGHYYYSVSNNGVIKKRGKILKH
jgi:hypothetical protein